MLHTVYVLNQTQGSLSQEERGTCTSGVSEWGSGDYHLEEVEVDSSDIQRVQETMLGEEMLMSIYIAESINQ